MREFQFYSFGPFELDIAGRVLKTEGRIVPLTPKEFETLRILVENHGSVVTKGQLIEQVWPGTFVGETSLTRNVSVIRKALGDGYIETVPKRGYRFILATTGKSSSLGYKTEKTEPPVRTEDVPSQPGQSNPDPDVVRPEAAATWEVADDDACFPLPGATSSTGSRHWKLALGFLVIAALSVIIFGRLSVQSRSSILNVEPSRPVTIAVMPFLNLTGQKGEEYMCDGLTEAMISELSRLSPGRLQVIARTSAMIYKNTPKSITEIGRELKADYVLEGAVRGDSDQIRVTAQLVKAADSSHVWTGEYQRSFRDVPALQVEIAIQIASEIDRSLIPDSSMAQTQHRVEPEAYRDYLLGRFYWNKRDRASLLRSVEYFQHAVARDPKYARGYAGLADAFLVLGGGYLQDLQAYGQGRTAALKALTLDDKLAEAYASLAYEEFVNERDWKGADENFQHSIILDPGYANAHHWYALYLAAMMRSSEAMREINTALNLDPLSTAINYNKGFILMQAQRYGEAIEQFKKALEIEPKSAAAHGGLALAYMRNGMYKEAKAEFRIAQNLRGEFSPYEVEIAHVEALEGNSDSARRQLKLLKKKRGWGLTAPYTFAVSYAALGEKDEAFRWLQASVDDHSCTVSEINTDPALAPLRSDPRFTNIRTQFRVPNTYTARGNKDN